MENCCRTCLRDKRSSAMKLLSAKWNYTVLSFGDMLMDVVNMNKEITSNETSFRICSSCESDLITAYKFKIVCQNTEKILAEKLTNTIFELPLAPIEEIKCETIKHDFSDNLDEISKDLIGQFNEQTSQTDKSKKPKIKSTFKNTVKRSGKEKTKKNNLSTKPKPDKNHEENLNSLVISKTVNEQETLISETLEKKKRNVYCRRCDITFEAEKFYRKHIRQTHKNDIKKKNALGRCIIKTEDGKIRKPSVYCKKCDIRFEAEKFYRKHCEEIHWQKLPCEVCGKLFLENRIKSHMVSHSSEKNHVCSYCGSKFSTTFDLRKHLRIHTGEKRFKCTFCDEKFIHSNSKTNHIYKVHTKEKKYECYICHKLFAQRGQMVIHIKYHLGDLRHPCSICDKRLPHKYALKRHELTHLTIRKQRVNKPKIIGENIGNLIINDELLLIEVSRESSVTN